MNPDEIRKLNEMYDLFFRMNQRDRFLLDKDLVMQKAHIRMQGRIQEAMGVDIVAANNLTLGDDGNVFKITGNTTINAITVGKWTRGNTITLLFTGTPTVKHATAGATGTAQMFLSGSADLTAAANTVLVLFYDGTQWQEKSRKVA